MTKANLKSELYFEIRGYVGGADHALCATAKSEIEPRYDQACFVLSVTR